MKENLRRKKSEERKNYLIMAITRKIIVKNNIIFVGVGFARESQDS